MITFKKIPGFEGRYAATSDGRIWSHSAGRFRSFEQNQGGRYYAISLYSGARATRTRHLVHRLVAAAFHGPCPDGYECRHLDGDMHNNHASNLAWGTHAENEKDKLAHGVRRGKLSPAQVAEIQQHIASGRTNVSIAAAYGVSDVAISCIRRGVTHALAR